VSRDVSSNKAATSRSHSVKKFYATKFTIRKKTKEGRWLRPIELYTGAYNCLKTIRINLQLEQHSSWS